MQVQNQPLESKRALITGASSGIGAATARALGQLGAHTTLVARREDRLTALAAELPSAAIQIADVRDPRAVEALFDGPAFDVVVANAGLALGVSPIHAGELEHWNTMIDTNVKGLLHTVRAALPSMRKKGKGDLVLLGSVAGRQVYPGGNVYSATKHAVRAIYEALRVDEVGSGLRFTTVDPGMVETEFSVIRMGDEEAASQVYGGMTPLGPEDIADAIAYAVTRPAHVNVGEIVMWPTDQGSTRDVHRRQG